MQDALFPQACVSYPRDRSTMTGTTGPDSLIMVFAGLRVVADITLTSLAARPQCLRACQAVSFYSKNKFSFCMYEGISLPNFLSSEGAKSNALTACQVLILSLSALWPDL